MHLAEGGQGAFEQLHLAEREQEGQGRLGPLVQVDAVFLEAVAAAAGLGVVEVQPQVVAAQEPLEGEPGLLEPERVVGGVVGLEAGRDGGVGLDRLLVELGRGRGRGGRSRWSRSGGSSRSATSAGRPASAGLAGPASRRALIAAGAAAGDQGVGQLGVVVGQDFLEPGPVVGRGSCREARSAGRSGCRGPGWPAGRR